MKEEKNKEKIEKNHDRDERFNKKYYYIILIFKFFFLVIEKE